MGSEYVGQAFVLEPDGDETEARASGRLATHDRLPLGDRCS